MRTAHDDHSTQEAFIGTDRSRRSSNVSWGAIFAGVVTFLALTVLLGIAAAAMGLQGSSGTAAGIWSVIALVVALAAAGYVAGALAVRAGLLHGFLTWATSMLAVLVLAGWLGSSLLGAVGNVAGTVAETVSQGTTVTSEDAQDAAGSVDEQDVDEAQQQAEDTAQDAQDTVAESTDDIAEGAWWAFAGALLGALIAAFAGMAGARSVINREEEAVVEHREVSRS
ncbi:hypothetical protein FY030_08075 [Ornithinimicrobium pratense]|uniref:Uncharacterized protein n=1 Tax=Ornithinimicrobium pratense TaxID=2593973 RepID=A0A5J6VAC4_9MICO|nr:hypothetical protein FY030_08075 [Ornithinimicrobium pratense]